MFSVQRSPFSVEYFVNAFAAAWIRNAERSTLNANRQR